MKQAYSLLVLCLGLMCISSLCMWLISFKKWHCNIWKVNSVDFRGRLVQPQTKERNSSIIHAGYITSHLLNILYFSWQSNYSRNTPLRDSRKYAVRLLLLHWQLSVSMICEVLIHKIKHIKKTVEHILFMSHVKEKKKYLF